MDQDLSYIIERLDVIDKRFDDKLDKILVQTTATNGKVINLQEWRRDVSKDIEDLKENKSSNKGRDIVINNIVRAIAAIALAFFVYWLGSQTK